MSLQQPLVRPLLPIALVVMVLVPFDSAESQPQAPIVQPGAPGEPSRRISAEEASDLAGLRFSDADAKFMQGMIGHHAQALEMTELLSSRSDRDTMHRLAQRIEISQADEISMMQEWLRARGQEVPDIEAHHADDAMLMPGMLTAEDMDRLGQTRSVAFDRLFLEFMITHHRGALTMVDELLSQRGTAQDSVLFAFTSDITSDQSMEIDRMDAMLRGLSTDPRVHLSAGLHDAGEASWNMELVAARPKPEGFYDPRMPAGRPTPSEGGRDGTPAAPAEPTPSDNDSETTEPAGLGGAENEEEEKEGEEEGDEDASDAARRGLLNFGNTDLAFAGDTLFEGNYHGFNAYSVEDPTSPQLAISVVCPGGQGDLSVVGNLVIMSVEQTRGRLDCGLQGVAEPVSAERFRGIRIFDISDLRAPTQVAAVQTCRGSHTHTVVTDPDDAGNIYVYGSGTGSVRPGEELEGCSDEAPAEDPNTALFRIDVIQIPVSRPEEARIVSRPRIFSDPESGTVAGLWEGGDHGPGTQSTSATTRCHDITAYSDIGLAAGACSGNGILLDISDPVNPVRVDQVIDPGFAYWHSATFNNDGTTVIFTDEWGGGGRARCRASDPREWGADAIFDIVNGKMQFRSYYKLPAPQTEQENCVAHNGSLVPVPGRDIFVQAWYQGGISVIDFTDSSNPVEIAFFDRGPIDADDLVMGGYWSAYFYRGAIYGTEIARGLDVLTLLPSEFLTQNELDAASLVAPGRFNAQQQRRIVWPAHPSVARAYLDQLTRSDALGSDQAEVVTDALDRVLINEPRNGVSVADELDTLATDLMQRSEATTARTQARFRALADTLSDLAERLQ